MKTTTIQLKKQQLNYLIKIKVYPRQTHNETIQDILKKTQDEYDSILKAQAPLFQTFWDNDEDQEWEDWYLKKKSKKE